MKRLLFITWDGPQVQYLEGLFSPILKGLQGNYEIHIVQFTWGDPENSEHTRKLLLAQGMSYTRITVGPMFFPPLGILLTMLRGTRKLRNYIRTHDVQVILFRSTYPALMTLPWKYSGRKRVFDTDGLPLEEKVDFGRMNPGGLSFRVLKWAEGASVRKADRVLIRSVKALDALPSGPADKFRVVLNGRDPSVYRLPETAEREAIRASMGLDEGTLLLVYCGSLGPQYCLPEMIQLLATIQGERKARLLILTGSPGYLDVVDPGSRERLLVYNLPALEVPRYLGAADAALALRQNSPSMRGVSPVKLGEYFLCGLPVVASAGIGDTREILAGNKACLVLEDHSMSSLAGAACWVEKVARDKEIQTLARRLGLERFSLRDSIGTYQKALEGL